MDGWIGLVQNGMGWVLYWMLWNFVAACLRFVNSFGVFYLKRVRVRCCVTYGCYG